MTKLHSTNYHSLPACCFFSLSLLACSAQSPLGTDDLTQPESAVISQSQQPEAAAAMPEASVDITIMGTPVSTDTIPEISQEAEPIETGSGTQTDTDMTSEMNTQSVAPTAPSEESDPGTEEPDPDNIIVMTPMDENSSAPVSCTADLDTMRERMLVLMNEARATARQCGGTEYPAAPAVTWNNNLQYAARVHSVDMSAHNFFSHTGSDGSSVVNRIESQGYEWTAVGENIAAGQTTARSVVTSWLTSPGHCSNIMNASFTEIAVACESVRGADFSRYWTNVLARPRP